METKNLEIKTYNCCGVDVTVQMDYKTGAISIVEEAPCGAGYVGAGYVKKNYIFAGRPVEFAAENWINILNAIKHAVESATSEMLEYKAAKQKEAEDTMFEMLDMANAVVKASREEPKKKGFFSKKK